MSHSFDAQRGLIIVNGALTGPSGVAFLRLAIDTGATSSLINSALLVSVGYDPATAPDRVEITTGSGVDFSVRLVVEKLSCLGKERLAFPVLAHTLPTSAGVDGLIGLDYFRGGRLTIDFIVGQIDLT
jgi:hypothetical protein